MRQQVQRRSSYRGQSLVEFALVTPIFLLILFGTIEGGRLLWTNHELSNGTREGARHAMVGGSKAKVKATQASVESRVINSTAGLRSDQITVTAANLGGDPGQTVVVTATYQYQPVVAMIFGVGSIDLSARTEVIIQH